MHLIAFDLSLNIQLHFENNYVNKIKKIISYESRKNDAILENIKRDLLENKNSKKRLSEVDPCKFEVRFAILLKGRMISVQEEKIAFCVTRYVNSKCLRQIPCDPLVQVRTCTGHSEHSL